MKVYQKAQLIAKNLPSGSYAAGCPADRSTADGPKLWDCLLALSNAHVKFCKACERSK